VGQKDGHFLKFITCRYIKLFSFLIIDKTDILNIAVEKHVKIPIINLSVTFDR